MLKILSGERGFSLMEIIAASVIGALVAGGTMTAFVISMKLARDASGQAEANQLAQQTIERFRDKVACRQADQAQGATWFNASCAVDTTLSELTGENPDGLLDTSTLKQSFAGARQYTMSWADCDEDGANDCMKVMTKVTWDMPE